MGPKRLSGKHRRWPKPKLRAGERDGTAMMHAELVEQLGDMDFHRALA